MGPRAEARLRAERFAAEIDGAIEGLIESMERYELEDNARGAIHQTGLLVRSTGTEVRAQAQAPEAQRLARDAAHGAEFVQGKASDAAHKVQEGSRNASEVMQEKADQATEFVEEKWDDLKQDVSHGLERVKHAAQVTTQETRQRGRLLAESGRRAKVAPKNMWKDTKKAAGAWVGGLSKSIGLYAAAGAVAIAAFVVLTIALVTWFNLLVGAPAGTFLVALLYAVAAGGAVFGARAVRRKGRKEAEEHMGDVRQEARGVVGPVKEAFSTHRVTRPQRMPEANIGRVEEENIETEPATRLEMEQASGPASITTSEWKRR